MKKITFVLLIISLNSFAQEKVGINTVVPMATLDVNGNLRVTETKESTDQAKYFLTIDENNIVRTVDKAKVLDDGGAEVVESRTYAILAKGVDQRLAKKTQIIE